MNPLYDWHRVNSGRQAYERSFCGISIASLSEYYVTPFLIGLRLNFNYSDVNGNYRISLTSYFIRASISLGFCFP